jgi:hypothetical protein
MQLQFTSEELQVLADIIEERDEELRFELGCASDIAAKNAIEKSRNILNSIEDQIIEQNLHFNSEELDTLGEVVTRYQQSFVKEGKVLEANEQQRTRLELLKHIRDRLAETCAMF